MDEANGPKTAVLRHIARSWPSIISRLRSISSTVIGATCVKTVSIRSLHARVPSASQDISSQMIFLWKLFDLIACMCEVSGDFMVSRIKDQVLPVAVELLDVYVQKSKASHNRFCCDSLVSKEGKLLYSLLDFFSRIYGQRECGLGLSALIPVAGTIILPFLANEGELHVRTMRVLKIMILIDCDALWRPLLQMSHRPLPPRPFGPQSSSINAEDRPECTTPLESGAEELIEFIESLPEQTIEIV